MLLFKLRRNKFIVRLVDLLPRVGNHDGLEWLKGQVQLLALRGLALSIRRWALEWGLLLSLGRRQHFHDIVLSIH